MFKRFAGTLGTLIAGIGIGMTATVMLAAPQQAQPSAPAPAAGRGSFGAPAGPCGPQGQLAAEFAKNVDPKSRCFEVRMYTVDKTRVGTGTFNGSINELHQRFREKEVAIFQKHGAQIVGVWQHLGNPDTLVWMLAYRDRAHREEDQESHHHDELESHDDFQRVIDLTADSQRKEQDDEQKASEPREKFRVLRQ